LNNKLLSKHQHGFLAKRSTLTNLLESVNDWTLTINNKQLQNVVYIDFSKAFDTVSQKKLVAKLQKYGITGDLLSVISDFLSGRSQRTKVGDCLSSNVSLKSGVVQGSCLGPLLFLIYVNDVFDIFNQPVITKLYADDLKLYSTIDCDQDNANLQQCLDKLLQWSEDWQLAISINKCQNLHVGNQNALHGPLAEAKFQIGSFNLPEVVTVRDLGVTVDCSMKFEQHINDISRRANTRARLILKCFQSRHTPTLLKAFTTYVRPVLEYNSPVWSPRLHKHIDLLEKVQRRFTKRLPGMFRVSYDDRLAALQLERLEARRLRSDVLTTYKIIFGHTIINSAELFRLNTEAITRGHHYKIVYVSSNCETRRHFLSNRVVSLWNKLPADTNFSTLTNFNQCINNFDFDHHCIGKR